jgi:hypothetical protein
MMPTGKPSRALRAGAAPQTTENRSRNVTRREFLKRTASAVAGAGAVAAAGHCPAEEIAGGPSAIVAIVADPTDPVANAGPAQWAIGQLKESLAQRQITAEIIRRIEDVPATARCVLAAGSEQPLAREILDRAQMDPPQAAESLALVHGRAGARAVLLACGRDPRGLAYALLELADRVSCADQPLEALRLQKPIPESPANQVRSNMRLFASDLEDKSWFYDRDYWQRYLSTLMPARFNRFSLALGLGYDFPSGIRDAYFHFAYPFLVTVPGYDVQVTRLAGGERERNLEMLRFISDETVARGLDFQLGLWTHAYQWINSPQANHTIEGLTPQTHAPYCRDALRTLLTACPSIGGVTFRVHGESGVAEGSYVFWKTVFEGLTQCGRPVGLDMHAKGMDAEMIEAAMATGLPVTISPKFWAEHMGLSYHQAAIRPTEMPPRNRKDEGFFSKSSGSRSFLRYGYGDLLAEGRGYSVVHRIWPGTQRLLLWGDPVLAAGYGRAASFCGSNGVEIFEPLSFKGRKGSGLPGGRDAYADHSLKLAPDFEKYAYSYRLWGRLLYNPASPPEIWQRQLSKTYGRAANAVEIALSNAGRILPLITTAHLPSAANNNFWPEIYTNMPIVDANRKHPYGDTPSPKRFGTVSPLDPQLFSRIDDFAEALLTGNLNGKYSPSQVADWLLELAETGTRALEKARGLAANPQEPGFRRVVIDAGIQINLGRFFARKLQAGVLYALYERTEDRRFLQRAVEAYRQARQTWSQLAHDAAGVYVSDITFGPDAHLRGHWQDRLPVIDQDIADMESRLVVSSSASRSAPLNPETFDKVMRALGKPERSPFTVRHVPPQSFQRDQPLKISLALSHGSVTQSPRIFYRHVNQAEEFQNAEMASQAGSFELAIPAEYTDSPFPLQYYFELRDRKGGAWMHPGLGPNLNHQPYYLVRSTARSTL